MRIGYGALREVGFGMGWTVGNGALRSGRGRAVGYGLGRRRAGLICRLRAEKGCGGKGRVVGWGKVRVRRGTYWAVGWGRSGDGKRRRVGCDKRSGGAVCRLWNDTRWWGGDRFVG